MTIPWTTVNEPTPDQPVVVMATRLELHRIRDVPGFLRTAMRIRRAVRRDPDAIGISLIAKPLRRRFWTMSAWRDARSMHAFVAGEVHRAAMVRYRGRMQHSAFTTWEALPSETFPPSWDDARRRLSETEVPR